MTSPTKWVSFQFSVCSDWFAISYRYSKFTHDYVYYGLVTKTIPIELKFTIEWHYFCFRFPFRSFFEFYRIPGPLDLTGPLEINNLLDNAEHLFEGQIHGPECLLKRDNEIYASTAGGEVVKISGDHITHVAKFGKPCGNSDRYSIFLDLYSEFVNVFIFFYFRYIACLL